MLARTNIHTHACAHTHTHTHAHTCTHMHAGMHANTQALFNSVYYAHSTVHLRPHRLVVRTSRCGRDNPGSTPGAVMCWVLHVFARDRGATSEWPTCPRVYVCVFLRACICARVYARVYAGPKRRRTNILAERSGRRPAHLMGLPRAGSNPAGVYLLAASGLEPRAISCGNPAGGGENAVNFE